MVVERFGICEPLVDPPGADVDIVFVHGLGGDRVKTWTWQDSHSSVYWPKDLLYRDCKTARILAFGYDADFAHFYPFYGSKVIAEELTIDVYSTTLFRALSGLREKTETSTRPLIFVAHSLGGLVVANVLSRFHGPDTASINLVERTIGALFLGTPFEGSSKAAWGTRGLGFIELMGGSVQKQNVKDLEERSYKLMDIHNTFQKFLKTRDRSDSYLEVACFFEQYAMKFGGVKVTIVPRESASLSGIEPLSIADNHSGMCKFEDEDREGYKDIASILRSWIAGIGQSSTSKRADGHASASMGDVIYQQAISGNQGVIMGNAYSSNKDGLVITGSVNASIVDAVKSSC